MAILTIKRSNLERKIKIFQHKALYQLIYRIRGLLFANFTIKSPRKGFL